MQFAALDWMVLVILVLSVVLGAWRGLVYEVLSVIGWIAAFVVAQFYARTVGDVLPMHGATESLRYAVGFVVVFIASAFAAGLLAWLAKKLIETVGLRPVDRVLGALFGVIRGAVIVLAATMVILMTPLKESLWWQQSAAAQTFTLVLQHLKPILPNAVGQYIQAGLAQPLREA